MPIVAIEERLIRQRCALCAREREVAFAALSRDEDAPADVLSLPPCACGAVEHLLRTPRDESEHPAPGSFGHLHRLLVDGLLDALRGAPAGDEVRLDGLLPEATRERWFPNGLRVHLARPEPQR